MPSTGSRIGSRSWPTGPCWSLGAGDGVWVVVGVVEGWLEGWLDVFVDGWVDGWVDVVEPDVDWDFVGVVDAVELDELLDSAADEVDPVEWDVPWVVGCVSVGVPGVGAVVGGVTAGLPGAVAPGRCWGTPAWCRRGSGTCTTGVLSADRLTGDVRPAVSATRCRSTPARVRSAREATSVPPESSCTTAAPPTPRTASMAAGASSVSFRVVLSLGGGVV